MKKDSLSKLLKWAKKEAPESFQKLCSISSLVVNSKDIFDEESFSNALYLNVEEMEALIDPDKVEVAIPKLNIVVEK